MATDVKVPSAGESISEVFIGSWLKKPGDAVAADEAIVELETDKATLDVPSPVAGVLIEVLKNEGDAAGIGEVIARVDETATATAAPQAAAPSSAAPAAPTVAAAAPAAQAAGPAQVAPAAKAAAPAAPAQPTPASPNTAAPAPAPTPAAPAVKAPTTPVGVRATSVMPAAQRLIDENGLSADEVPATGPGGRLLKEDVQNYLAHRERAAAEPEQPLPASVYEREEEVKPMTLLRRRIAERLVSAQQTAALLTTFNEVDMSGVMSLRSEYKDAFEKRYGVRLGFMSFFVKAAIDALKQVPQLNAEIRGTDMVFKNYYDIGVAVSTPRGLVVPVVRDAERLSFAEVEQVIAEYGKRASANKITPDELQGGTFTISNGGVFGSLLSTPIVNPPQSGVLGMHTIQERPVAIDGQVVIRPMMYLALTYDHRVVDGREAVTFLKRIKDTIEKPARMLLEV
ncbi:MAG TPA: 2-oxoglutarate dehydrogenase complex dihydrolipoyllysine-residue succinyltransferase [Trueperaceae bacterium]|nr:2-oxoglutarate dehydrogenase complex dihydrolipoyllysine-residue succinyltransferase [Trueperaceae bacterium]